MSTIREDYIEAGKMLSGWSKVLLLAHERPDGDALGCLIGLTRFLRSMGKQPSAICFGAPAPRYGALLARTQLTIWQKNETNTLPADLDGIVLLDTCSLSQLAPVAEKLKEHTLPVLAIDHHVTRDPIADCYVVDESASSACLMVVEMADVHGWEIDRHAAEALFTGIATDTGWFQYSNTDARTLQAASRMLAGGVKPDELYQAYYMADSPARLRLVGRMLTDMELHSHDRLALLAVTMDMVKQCAAGMSDIEELVNEPMQIGSVEVSILLAEQGDGVVKISLRSKREVDCARVASRFGGGGHQRAAGARISGDIITAKEMIVEAVKNEMANQAGAQ